MSTLKVDNIRHNNATSDAITMAADGTCTGNITNKPNYNLLINGQFDVWQRSTSSNSTTGSGYVSADRWRFEASGATYNTSQQVFAPGQTDVPSNPKYYLRFNVTTANDNTAVTQRIEDVDSVQGQHTLSFWAKGTNPAGGSIQVVFLQDFGSGGSSVVSGIIGNFSLSSSWAKQTFTFTPPSISGKTIGTSSYFNIRIRQPSADDTTTAWNIDLANVKLEAGSKATDYQRVGFGDELARCQRYFFRMKAASNYSAYGMGGAYSSTQAVALMHFPVPMRKIPDFSYNGNLSQFYDKVGGGSSFSSIAITQVMGDTTTGIPHLELLVLGTFTAGNPFILSTYNNTSTHLNFDAELPDTYSP